MEWLWSFLVVNKVYVLCAIVGGSIMLLQIVLGLFGVGDQDADGDGVDVDHDADHDSGLHVLSVRAVAGFLTFFGLVGWACQGGGMAPGWTALLAFLAGLSVMVFIAWVMRLFRRMTQSGNVDPGEAIGKTATVYLRVPGQRAGKGKITLSLGGRTVELQAVTAGNELPTGSSCRVVAQTTDDTFEVAGLEA